MAERHRITTRTIPAVRRGGEEPSGGFSRGPLLLVLYGDELGKRFFLAPGEHVFGRSLKSDHVIDNPSVSRSHFSVVVHEEESWLVDAGSMNGTFVNGVRIRDRIAMSAGDLVSLGNVILKFMPYEESDRFYSHELFRMSTIDPLTDAYNKQYFLGILSKEVERSLRYQNPLTIIQLDIDRFRDVNEHFGEAAGDATLRGIGRIIVDAVRKQDVFARYNDDGFAILLPETNIDRAEQVGRRLLESISKHQFRHGTDSSFAVTVSMGVVSLSDKIASVSALLRAVDEALYRARQAGGNQLAL
jgi:two-component system, cell cycle response regulator